jgi:hypothetical protein
MMIADANAYSYTIARMNDEGNWVALESFDSYSEAELNYDKYEDMYPYALIEIISSAE